METESSLPHSKEPATYPYHLELNWSKYEAHYSSASIDEFQDAWSSNSNSQKVFIGLSLIKDRDKIFYYVGSNIAIYF
jgi:hypothetical protein